MNGKVSKMIKKIHGGKKDKRQWNSFPHTLRGRIRAAFKNDAKLIYRRPLCWPT